MNATLSAWATLLSAGFMTHDEYIDSLHALYLENPDNDLLYRLEMSTANKKETFALLYGVMDVLADCEKPAYAMQIFEPLEKIYRTGIPILEFNIIAQRIWNAILHDTNYEEPFVFLTMADDYLDDSIRQEPIARELFEQAFHIIKGEFHDRPHPFHARGYRRSAACPFRRRAAHRLRDCI